MEKSETLRKARALQISMHMNSDDEYLLVTAKQACDKLINMEKSEVIWGLIDANKVENLEKQGIYANFVGVFILKCKLYNSLITNEINIENDFEWLYKYIEFVMKNATLQVPKIDDYLVRMDEYLFLKRVDEFLARGYDREANDFWIQDMPTLISKNDELRSISKSRQITRDDLLSYANKLARVLLIKDFADIID